MGSLSSSDHVEQTHGNVNISIPSILSPPPLVDTSTAPNSSPRTPTSRIITIDDVDNLELEQYKRKRRQLELALQAKQEEQGRTLTNAECTEIEKLVDATEKAGRDQARPITITHSSGATEAADLSELPPSYKQIRNLLWIESQPVYKAALEEWKSKVATFGARVERKIERSGVLKNEIYNIIGFYSVFQGVLLTSTSQSNYLHCQNVALVVALSVFASVCCLLGIHRKFNRILDLEKTICSELYHLKEAKARIFALRRRGEAFRFYDFLEDTPSSTACPPSKFKLCGLRSRYLVLLAIGLFSVLFIMAHPLILCHPGHKPGDSK